MACGRIGFDSRAVGTSSDTGRDASTASDTGHDGGAAGDAISDGALQTCGITHFRLWNSANAALLDDFFVNREKFCKNSPGVFKPTIEAVGDACGDGVTFTASGPRNYTPSTRETVPPYFMFGNIGGEILDGNLVIPGIYQLTVSSDGTFLPVTLTFEVEDC